MAFLRRKIGEIPAVLQSKWPGRTLDEGFTPFPKRLLRCMDKLFVGEKAVNWLRIILSITDYLRPQMTRLPSIEFLAFTAGMTVAEFKTGMNEMAELGWVSFSGSDEAVNIKIDGLNKKIQDLTAETVDELLG